MNIFGQKDFEPTGESPSDLMLVSSHSPLVLIWVHGVMPVSFWQEAVDCFEIHSLRWMGLFCKGQLII